MENLIRWLPWGQEAFQRAKAENKPIFLHIGFPSCHWCHVMERESFQNPEIAEYLNEHYIPIDVDREQRPDIDAIYMAACQATTGQGGWPLTALLSPDQSPFFVTTYMPPKDLMILLTESIDMWRTERDQLNTLGMGLKEAVRAQFDQGAVSVPPERRLMRSAVRAYASSFDTEWGGTGIAPKFPMAHTLLFLLRFSHVAEDPSALSMAELTLTRMCEGSVFDHVGGGFMRYAADRHWTRPHYEKMLSDNAPLIDAYLEAWQITGRALYRNVAERTLQYVLREMTADDGGFYASQDADSDGREGAHYLLSRHEVITLLGRADGEAYANYYGLDASGGLPSRVGHDGGIQTQRMAALGARVLAYRAERMSLRRDDKIVTAWNAQMIAALANAYMALGDRVYLDAAVKAARWSAERLQSPSGEVYPCWREGNAAGVGTGLLDDYAQLALAALALYRATLEDRWLTWAVSLARAILSHFEDREKGGFYLTPHDGETLLARPKETYDGAQPSGNSAALTVFATLATLDVGEGWADVAKRQAAFLMGVAADAPAQHMAALTATIPLVYPVTLLDAHAAREENEKLLDALHGRYMPLLFLKSSQPGIHGNTWRLCKGTACLAPFQAMEQALDALTGNRA